jgi:hypothetical protein
MQASIIFVLLVALLCGTFSSAMLRPSSGQQADQSLPVALLPPIAPSTLPISKRVHELNTPQTWECIIAQFRGSTDKCAEKSCRQQGGRCLPEKTGRRCLQHVAYSGGPFPNAVHRMAWPSWLPTKDACRGCGCMKYRPPKKRQKTRS